MTTPVSPETLRELMGGDQPHAVLDVREPMEFHGEQIHGTTSLPRGWLEFRIRTLVPVKGTAVVLVGDGDARADRAAETLERHGYTGVQVLSGGLLAWRAANLPTVSGTNVPSKEFGERVLHEDHLPEIEVQELHNLIQSGEPLRIFDSRTEAEYERFSIPTGRSLPGGELILHAWDLAQDKDSHLIVNCAGRTRSIIGAGTLHKLGVSHARALRNGGMGFMLAGLPLDNGRPSEIPQPSEQSRRHGEELAGRLAKEEGILSISVDELRTLQEKPDRETLYLLDVRLGPEYKAGHIPGAISIPGGQAVQRTDEIAAVRAGTVVTYCDTGARSTMTAYWLRRMGLPKVFFLQGGLSAWEGAGFAVDRAEPAADGESPASSGGPIGLEEARAAVKALSPAEGLMKVGAGAAVLDVDLSPGYRKGHLQGGRWISRAFLEERVESFCPDRSRPVLVTCCDGMRSAFSAAALSGMGYEDVSFIDGGKRAWSEAGFSLEEGDQGFEGPVIDVALKPYDIGPDAMEEYLSWEENLGKE